MNRRSQDAKKNYVRVIRDLGTWLAEKGVKYGNLSKIALLCLDYEKLTNIPRSIGQLTNLQILNLRHNRLTILPESIGQLCNLEWINLDDNPIVDLSPLQKLNRSTLKVRCFGVNLPRRYWTKLSDWQPVWLFDEDNAEICHILFQQIGYERICSLYNSIEELERHPNLEQINLTSNHLTSLPELIVWLFPNLEWINLDDNPIVDLSPLQKLNRSTLTVRCFGVNLPRRYWIKLSNWQPAWLLDEDNAEIRRTLIQHVGYERICSELGANKIDSWREYTLLKIDDIEPGYYDPDSYDFVYEPMMLIEMTCPSTGHTHILRVPPSTASAEEAIMWVNHGIHPDRIAVAT